MRERALVRVGDRVIATRRIRSIDLSRLETLEVSVELEDEAERLVVRGADAIHVVMVLCPEAFEGRRLRFVRRAWAVHNMIGHPVLQLLSWLGMTRLGLAVHDATVPRPAPT